jgi:hypothetical protein
MLRVLMSGGYVAIGSLIVDSAGKHDRTVYGAEGTTGLMSEVECSELSAQEVAARPDLRALFRITDEV